MTFFKNLQPNFPTPGSPKAEPKKGTIKISPNKTLQSFINVAASPKIHVPVTAAIIRFNLNPCYTAYKPLGESARFVSLNLPFLVKGTKNVSFISLQ